MPLHLSTNHITPYMQIGKIVFFVTLTLIRLASDCFVSSLPGSLDYIESEAFAFVDCKIGSVAVVFAVLAIVEIAVLEVLAGPLTVVENLDVEASKLDVVDIDVDAAIVDSAADAAADVVVAAAAVAVAAVAVAVAAVAVAAFVVAVAVAVVAVVAVAVVAVAVVATVE